jgi:hypothetical protein
MNKEDLRVQMVYMNTPNIKDITTLYQGALGQEDTFAHIDGGWKINVPNTTTVTAPEFPLYSPITEKGDMIIVNGYLVDSNTNEYTRNYNDFTWESCLTPEVMAAIEDLPLSLKQYIHYRKNITPEQQAVENTALSAVKTSQIDLDIENIIRNNLLLKGQTPASMARDARLEALIAMVNSQE